MFERCLILTETIAKCDYEYETNGNELESEEMDRIGSKAFLMTGLTCLKMFFDCFEFGSFGSICRDDDDFESLILEPLSDEVQAIKTELGISQKSYWFIHAFYKFRFDFANNGCDAIDSNAESLFNFSRNQKNWTPAEGTDGEKYSILMSNCRRELISIFESEIWDNNCDQMEKYRIVKRFWDEYEARNTDLIQMLETFDDCETYRELIDRLNDWCQALLWADEDGNPSDEDFTDGIILDCVKWW